MNDRVDYFRVQSETCREMGSAIYGELLESTANQLEAEGPLTELFEGWQGNVVLDNLPLRWMGALHYLALTGEAPSIAQYFPSTGGRFQAEPACQAVLAFAAEYPERIRPLLEDCIQTNEVQRCTALFPGLLTFNQHAELPVRLLEIGSSAGLNLGMDRYGYKLGDHTRGQQGSALQLNADWKGLPPPDGVVEISERRGCDLEPIDISNPARSLRLRSFFWPDQAERGERLANAIALNLAPPPTLAAKGAGEWLGEELAVLPDGVGTLLFHSVMWWYVPKPERQQIRETVEAAGARATKNSPLGWLRMEGSEMEFCELRLRTWPGDEERLLARTHYHGAWVEWLGGSSS